MNKIICFFLLIFSFTLYFPQSIKGFHVPDSLKNKSFEQLRKSYEKVFRIDNNRAELYANTILSKGKKEKNNDLVYDGYYKIAHVKGLKSENGHPYADSLFKITKNINTKDYPAKAYIIKGILLNYEFKYNDALDQYIKAQELSKDKNLDQFYYIKKLIGILKTATDENKEALPLFLEYYEYEKLQMKSNDKDIKSYIGSIASVSNSYSKNGNYHQSKVYNEIGREECKKYDDYTHYPYFILLDGIADYYLKNYSKSTTSLLEVEKRLLKNKDYGNLSIVYYCLGKINYETNKEEKAIQYFIKSDSLSFISNDFIPKTRDRYEILIDYYKKKGDKENQLKFIDKLFFADSIINNSKQYLSKEIYKKYDTPILLQKKEELIADLHSKNSVLYVFLGMGGLIIGILFYLYIQNKKKITEYKKHADKLLQKLNVTTSSDVENVIIDNLFKEQKSKNLLSDKNLQEIKIKLDLFEKNKDFLRKNITVDNLARDFESNRDYLSKSVNELKGKNFSQYINELRINYIVDELKNNEKLRRHTISAIGSDIGYNNSESFSNAFRKITGTLPSYYIKLLQEKE